MINNMLSCVRQAFEQKSIPDMDDFYSGVIAPCLDIYSGAPSWLRVRRPGLYKKSTRQLNCLGMAKILCDEMSALTFSEKTEINVSDKHIQALVDNVLADNGFYKSIPAWLSACYAAGGGALKVYAAEGKILIDYLTADCFIPTEFTNSRITGGVFCSTHTRGQNFYTLMELYGINGGGTEIEHKLFCAPSRGQLGAQVSLSELYDNPPPEYALYDGITTPLFAYFKPAAANNLDIGSPLGVPIYANCVDTLRGLDVAFDSYCREFVLGKKRIIVPSSCIRTVVDPETGEVRRYFDTDDEAYQALKCDDDKDLKITDNTMTLRITEHVDGINGLLNILCTQTGFSSGTFSFTSGGVKTATEIISENSKTFRTAKSNKNMLSETFDGLVRAIAALGGYFGYCPRTDDYEVLSAFNDSIIEDDNTIIDNNIKLVSAGLKSKLSAIMDVLKCDAEAAQEELDRINAELNTQAFTEGDYFDPTAD